MESLITFIIYLSIAFWVTFLSKIAYYEKNKKYKKMVIFVIINIMAITAGIRYNVGTDWLQYYSGPKLVGGEGYLGAKQNYEIGYILICRIVYFFGFGGTTLLYIYSFLTSLFFFLTINNYSKKINVPITVFMYICLYYLVTFNITRQALAISIGMYAISNINIINQGKFSLSYLLKNNLKFILFSTIAFLFHQSAIICFIALPLCYFMRKNNIWRIVFFAIIITVIWNYRILIPIALKITCNKAFKWYFVAKVTYKGSWLKYFFRYFPFIFTFALAYKKIINDSGIFDIYNLSLIGLIVNSLCVITSTEIERISFYFLYFITIVMGFSFKHMEEIQSIWGLKIRISNKNIYNLYKIFMYFFTILTMWYIFFYKGMYEVVPYRTIFNK